MNTSLPQVVIAGVGSISPLGTTPEEVWNSYRSQQALIKPRVFDQRSIVVGSLPSQAEEELGRLIEENSHYKELDRTVHMAMFAARQSVRQAGWKDQMESNLLQTGVNIGSSRGATGLFEKYHRDYLRNSQRQISPLTSPTTTLGNISTWVAHDLAADGPAISHSVTCTTALHAIGNGIAWVKAGMSDRFLVGASEAPLTGFTLNQIHRLRLYSNDLDSPFPCRPCSDEKPGRNTLVLGEGAAIFALAILPPNRRTRSSFLPVIESFGYGMEPLDSKTSVAKDGAAFQKAMLRALNHMTTQDPVDLILLHAPGTIKGDEAELRAVKEVFGEDSPILLSNKWVMGHTFGASGALSLEYALLILKHNHFEDFPYPTRVTNRRRPIRKILVNAAGFGGNAASLIVSRG